MGRCSARRRCGLAPPSNPGPQVNAARSAAAGTAAPRAAVESRGHGGAAEVGRKRMGGDGEKEREMGRKCVGERDCSACAAAESKMREKDSFIYPRQLFNFFRVGSRGRPLLEMALHFWGG